MNQILKKTNITLSTVKLFLLILVLYVCVKPNKCKAQSAYFNFTDGSNSSYNLSDIRKITFSNNDMNLHLWDGSIYSWNINTIGHFEYDENSLSNEELIHQINSMNVDVYPNPVDDKLYIQFFLSQKYNVSIMLFEMNGKKIIEHKIDELSYGKYSETLELKSIPQGNYILKIMFNNKSIIKNIVKS
jgi:hypothetical protein